MDNPKILIVDDEPFNIDYIEQELEDSNYELITAVNGQGALAKVQAESPDLILLDIMMPVMDGFEVLARLQASPSTRDIPVIVISASNNPAKRGKGHSIGRRGLPAETIRTDIAPCPHFIQPGDEKIWARHAIAEGAGGRSLLYVDRHLLHDGSFHAFSALEQSGRRLRRPDACFAVPDHYVPTRNRAAGIADGTVRARVQGLTASAHAHKVVLFDVGDPRQGIVHVVGPEQGITQPGVTLVCGDSHTSTHGALGALAFGIGASEVAHVLATQTLWQRKSKTLRVSVEGRLGAGVHQNSEDDDKPTLPFHQDAPRD